MILLTTLQGERFVLNCDEILRVLRVPDTVVELKSGKRFYVSEAPGEVIIRVGLWRRACNVPIGLADTSGEVIDPWGTRTP